MPAPRIPRHPRPPIVACPWTSSKPASTWSSSRSAPWEVLDQDVLDLLFSSGARIMFPPAHRSLAFADLEIPLGGGERDVVAEAGGARAAGAEARDRRESVARDRHRQRLLHRAAREPRRARDDRRDRCRRCRRRESEARRGRLRQRRRSRRRRRRARIGSARRYDAIVLTGSTPVLPEAFCSSSSRAAACSRSSATRRR